MVMHCRYLQVVYVVEKEEPKKEVRTVVVEKPGPPPCPGVSVAISNASSRSVLGVAWSVPWHLLPR